MVYNEEGRALWYGGELVIFEDGTTSLDKANMFLKECVPEPRQYVELENILWEELEVLNSGDKDLETVAEIVDNRIQLYLDERY